MKRRIRIVEVGPRDGLQNEANFCALPEEKLVDARFRFITALADAGFKDVEAGAFVRPDRVPQMAFTSKVIERLQRERPDLWKSRRFWTLVPNQHGLDQALTAGIKHIAVFTSTSNAFNRANINMSVRESIAVIRDILKNTQDLRLKVRAYISTVWGCPYSGKTSPHVAARITKELLDLGVEEVSLGDTIGVATPNRVSEVLKLFKKHAPLAVHFHDTRGTALANCLRAIEEGIDIVDASAGGLGGCPYAKGASGNLATEDLLYMLHGMKFTSGINLDTVCLASEEIAEKLQLSLPSRYHRAWKAARS